VRLPGAPNDPLINVKGLVISFNNNADFLGKRINGGFDPESVEWSDEEDTDAADDADGGDNDNDA
jgi:hypothetical protein